MLSIQNHRLVGDNVSFRQTPNVGGALAPRFVVLHYTAGRNLESSVESLCTIHRSKSRVRVRSDAGFPPLEFDGR